MNSGLSRMNKSMDGVLPNTTVVVTKKNAPILNMIPLLLVYMSSYVYQPILEASIAALQLEEYHTQDY